MPTDIKVLLYYQEGEPFDKRLESAITDFFKAEGYNWWAQGFEIDTNIRDICFSRG